MRLVFIFSILFFLSIHSFADIPNLPYNVPKIPQVSGSLCNEQDPDFKNYRYEAQIPYCSRNVTNQTKTAIYEHYRIPAEQRKYYTIDHIIPLSIGGSNNIDNLWPEHREIKHCRYNLELHVFKELSNDKITQEEAIKAIMKVKYQSICWPN